MLSATTHYMTTASTVTASSANLVTSPITWYNTTPPGCSEDSNCPVDLAHCTSIHSCTGDPGYPGLVKITVQTYDCTGCKSTAEGGLVITIDDDSEATQPCTTSGLDNADKRDYDNGNLAEFLANEDNGMEACQYVSDSLLERIN